MNCQAADAVQGRRMNSWVQLLHVETHTGFPRLCTRHPVESAGAQAKPGSAHEVVNQHQRHTPAHWCRRRALTTFHRLVQSVTVGNVNQCAPTDGMSAWAVFVGDHPSHRSAAPPRRMILTRLSPCTRDYWLQATSTRSNGVRKGRSIAALEHPAGLNATSLLGQQDVPAAARAIYFSRRELGSLKR